MANGGIAWCTMQISWTGYQWPLAWTHLIGKLEHEWGLGLIGEAWTWKRPRLEHWITSNYSWCCNVRIWKPTSDGAQSLKVHHSTLKKVFQISPFEFLFSLCFFLCALCIQHCTSESSMLVFQELKFSFKVVTCVCVFVSLEFVWFCQFEICVWLCHFLC